MNTLKAHPQLKRKRAYAAEVSVHDPTYEMPKLKLKDDPDSSHQELFYLGKFLEISIKEEPTDISYAKEEAVLVDSFIEKEQIPSEILIKKEVVPMECSLDSETMLVEAYINGATIQPKKKAENFCNLCNKTFTQKSTLNQHMQLHNGEKIHVCSICDHRFALRIYLDQHYKTHIGIKPNKCGVCSASFVQRSALVTHEKIHNKEKKYGCEHCDMRYCMKSSLKKHSEAHHNLKVMEEAKLIPEVSFECNGNAASNVLECATLSNKENKGSRSTDCGSKNRFGLNDRLLTNSSPGMVFRRINNEFEENNMSSNGIKSEQQSQSDTTYFVSSRLRNRRINSNPHIEKSTLSSLAPAHISQFSAMKGEGKRTTNRLGGVREQQSASSDENTFPNAETVEETSNEPEEPSDTESNAAMTKNMTNLHDTSEEHASSEAVINSNLNSNMENRNQKFLCDLCGKNLSCKASLIQHKKIIHERIKSCICDHCGRLFGLRCYLVQHLKIHSGVKPYQCRDCGKSFAQRSAYVYHRNRWH